MRFDGRSCPKCGWDRADNKANGRGDRMKITRYKLTQKCIKPDAPPPTKRQLEMLAIRSRVYHRKVAMTGRPTQITKADIAEEICRILSARETG